MNNLFYLVLVVGIMVFPFIMMMVLLKIYRRKGKAPASVIGHVADLTTPFLFLGIYVATLTIFNIGIGLYMATAMLVIAIIYAVLEKKGENDFRVIRFSRKVWRLFFIILASVYIVLLITGVVLKIIAYVR